MAELDPGKLFDVCKLVFETPREVEILAHAGLAFCSEHGAGKSLGFSSQRITDGINALFKDYAPFKDSPVQDATVKRFLWRFTVKPRYDLVAKVGAFIVSECINNQARMEHPVIKVVLDSWDFVSEVKQQFQLRATETERDLQHKRDFDGFVRGLRRITQHPEGEKVFEDFFATDNPDLKDTRYYLSYRYSLTRSKLIKTFLAISTPACNDNRFFEYWHMHRHTAHAPVHRETLRRSHGVLLDIHKSYYLVGISVLRHPGGTWPHHAEGIQVISLEKDQFTQGLAGLRALFFTNNNSMYPMTGRSALILLGSESDIGEQNYETFDLDVFSKDDLDGTVQSDLRRFSHIDASQAIAFIRDVIDLNHMNLENTLPAELSYQIRKPAVALPEPPQ
jgi:hypothetical protein